MASAYSSKFTAEGLECVEKISNYVHAVGRVNDTGGSCILLSLPTADMSRITRDGGMQEVLGDSFRSSNRSIRLSPFEIEKISSMAVLLTTSHVFPCRESATGSFVTFLEKTVAGAAAQFGRQPQPLTVRTRSDAVFITSISNEAQTSAARQLQVGESTEGGRSTTAASSPQPSTTDEIGYSITCCDVKPLKRNMRYTMGESDVSFAGKSYSIRTASAAESFVSLKGKKNANDDLFLVKPLPLPLLLSSISPVHEGDIHLLITFTDGVKQYIVKKVEHVEEDFCTYVEDKNSSPCSGGPVFNKKGDFVGIQHQTGKESICLFSKSITKHLFAMGLLGVCRAPISDLTFNVLNTHLASTNNMVTTQAFKKQKNADGLKRLIDVGRGGDQLANFKDVERLQRQRTKEIPVPQREPSFEEVYDEFFYNFYSLLLMLRSFSYSSALTKKILQEIVKPEHLNELKSVSADGGVGFILEVIDGHPQDEGLIVSALTALSRICLYESNLQTFIQVDGVPSVMEILKEYIHEPRILQWGIYCLVQVTKVDAPRRSKTVEYVAQMQGIEMAHYILYNHGGLLQAHLTDWTAKLLYNIIEVNHRFVAIFLHENLPSLLVTKLIECKEEPSLVASLLKLLSKLLLPYAHTKVKLTVKSCRRRKRVIPHW
ncbi:hypothetical protein AGDE_14346 [Angomonas deanei]|uniref:Uncharacterized protein n=1 Tax=Angomonas deanei TaxID=59799 RepID=A0A7G2C9Y2_9TRYP|nr:hypothetical protein AGDE_14346 [Angomonas deanei]CAD2215861.1 hypothetical protein, conserved [Angomonas deanei]|eukprot:EPY20980.1 hypothetical protein AGDE_14346 [Angomonas deanei]